MLHRENAPQIAIALLSTDTNGCTEVHRLLASDDRSEYATI